MVTKKTTLAYILDQDETLQCSAPIVHQSELLQSDLMNIPFILNEALPKSNEDFNFEKYESVCALNTVKDLVAYRVLCKEHGDIDKKKQKRRLDTSTPTDKPSPSEMARV